MIAARPLKGQVQDIEARRDPAGFSFLAATVRGAATAAQLSVGLRRGRDHDPAHAGRPPAVGTLSLERSAFTLTRRPLPFSPPRITDLACLAGGAQSIMKLLNLALS